MNPLDDVGGNSDSGSEAGEPNEQPYLDLWELYDKKEPKGFLSKKQTVNLLFEYTDSLGGTYSYTLSASCPTLSP